MKFLSCILLALSIAANTSIGTVAAVPESGMVARKPAHKKLADGHYEFKLSPNGTIIGQGVLISTFDRQEQPKNASDASLQGRALAKRFPGTVEEAVNLNEGQLPHDDVVEARNRLKAWCDAGNQVIPFTCQTWVVGGALTSVVNHGWWNPCSSGEWQEAIDIWNGNGWAWLPSSIYIEDWAKGYKQDFEWVGPC